MVDKNRLLFLVFGLFVGGLIFYPLGRFQIRKDVQEITVVPIPTVTNNNFTEDHRRIALDREETQKRCGDIPDIKEMVAVAIGRNIRSEARWSPNCKYVVWMNQEIPFQGGWIGDEEKQTVIMSPTMYKAKINEGVFLYNSCNNKSNKIYVPKSSEAIQNINWLDNNNVSFSIGETTITFSMNE